MLGWPIFFAVCALPAVSLNLQIFESAFEVGVLSLARPESGAKFTGNIDTIRGKQTTKVVLSPTTTYKHSPLSPFVSVSPSLYVSLKKGCVDSLFALTTSRLLHHRFRPPTPALAVPAWPQTWTRPTSVFRCVHVSLSLSVSAEHCNPTVFSFSYLCVDAGSQASADPAAWKGRSKDESEYSKSMQKGKEGAYAAESGWVSGQSAADRAARFVCLSS